MRNKLQLILQLQLHLLLGAQLLLCEVAVHVLRQDGSQRAQGQSGHGGFDRGSVFHESVPLFVGDRER